MVDEVPSRVTINIRPVVNVRRRVVVHIDSLSLRFLTSVQKLLLLHWAVSVFFYNQSRESPVIGLKS